MKRISHWIDGKVAPGASGRTGKVFNPATGEVQAEVDFADVSEIDRAVATAKAARDALEATSPEQLWTTDLDEFNVAWTAYCAWRDALTAETAAESAGAKKKITKATGAKKTVAKKA